MNKKLEQEARKIDSKIKGLVLAVAGTNHLPDIEKAINLINNHKITYKQLTGNEYIFETHTCIHHRRDSSNIHCVHCDGREENCLDGKYSNERVD